MLSCVGFGLPSISLHFTPLTKPSPPHPLSINTLLLDLPSPQPLLTLSLGFGCGEMSLSLMTVGSADSGGMIEEGLLERRGKWSAN
ncbi:hypothetical protein JOQ06_015443, partial [Pogonophryne albipinna]